MFHILSFIINIVLVSYLACSGFYSDMDITVIQGGNSTRDENGIAIFLVKPYSKLPKISPLKRDSRLKCF